MSASFGAATLRPERISVPMFLSETSSVRRSWRTTVRCMSSTPCVSRPCRAVEPTSASATDWISGLAATAFGTLSTAASVIFAAISACTASSSSTLTARLAKLFESKSVSST